MGGEWRQSPLSDLIKESSTITYGVVKPGREGEITFIRGGDINNGRIIIENLRTITKEISQSYKRTILEGGELLVSLVGNPGQVALVPHFLKGANIARQVGLIRLDSKKILPEWVKYFLLSPIGQKSLGSHSIGSVQQVINLRDLKTVQIPQPPLTEQRAIAHILGTLDDKIELNRQMNHTLEAMAQALFKSWFVDFDPVVVNALRAGNPVPEKFAQRAAHYRDNPDALRLPEDTLRQFPDRFQDSELGAIPEGWEASTICAEFYLTMGQSPPGTTYNEFRNGMPFFQGRRDFGFRYPSLRVYCTAPTRIASRGDTLVSVRAPVGDINMAYEDCCVGRGLAALRHKSGSRSYTYYAMQSLGEQFKRFEAEGTVFGSINKKQFKNLPSLKVAMDIVSVLVC